MFFLTRCDKNIKMHICQFLTYPDIVNYLRTCQINYKLYHAADFWRYVSQTGRSVIQDGNRIAVRDAFLDEKIKATLLNEDMSRYCPEVSNYDYYHERHITKYDNVLFCECKNSKIAAVYNVLYLGSDMLFPIYSYLSDVPSLVLFDSVCHELICYYQRRRSIAIINTECGKVVSEKSLMIMNSKYICIDVDIDQVTKFGGWIKSGYCWSYQNGKITVVLDLVEDTLIVTTI